MGTEYYYTGDTITTTGDNYYSNNADTVFVDSDYLDYRYYSNTFGVAKEENKKQLKTEIEDLLEQINKELTL